MKHFLLGYKLYLNVMCFVVVWWNFSLVLKLENNLLVPKSFNCCTIYIGQETVWLMLKKETSPLLWLWCVLGHWLVMDAFLCKLSDNVSVNFWLHDGCDHHGSIKINKPVLKAAMPWYYLPLTDVCFRWLADPFFLDREQFNFILVARTIVAYLFIFMSSSVWPSDSYCLWVVHLLL